MTKTNFTFRTDSELKTKFVEEAKANGTTATALLQQWMEDYVNKKKPCTDTAHTDSTYSTDTAQNPTAPDRADEIETIIREKIEERMAQLERNFNYSIEEQTKDKITQQFLDERLGAALEPLWESLDYMGEKIDTVNSAIALLENSTYSTDNALTTSTNNVCADSTYSTDTALTEKSESAIADSRKETTIEKLAKDEELQKFIANRAPQKTIANQISDLLISAGIKKEGYKIGGSSFSTIKKYKSRPTKGDHIAAWELYQEALAIARDRKEIK